MAINVKLRPAWGFDPGRDPRHRSWAGWDPRLSEEENWDVNRGDWNLGPRANRERLATFSLEGYVCLVARLTGFKRLPAVSPGMRAKSAMIGEVLPVNHPARRALVGTWVGRTRNPVTYLDSSEADALLDTEATAREPSDLTPGTFILSHNPARWVWDAEVRALDVEATLRGSGVAGRWSTGSRSHGIVPGDRVFLLQQGPGTRGITASGIVTSDVYLAEHWDTEMAKDQHYVDVTWDVVLPEQAPLPVQVLKQEAPGHNWEPRAGGQKLDEATAAKVEQLWAGHVDRPAPKAGRIPRRGAQAWSRDPIRRRKVEDAAQRRLEQWYADQGWTVVDERYTKPYDAVATKDGATLYLEAKGTETAGDALLVTPGEVAWTVDHPGQCVMGVLSDIRFTTDDDVDPASGTFRIFEWNPQEGELAPTQYVWRPPAGGSLLG